VLAVRHTEFAVLLCALWIAASAVWWLRSFLDYYLDAWVITDQGIIDLEWLGWFHRQSARILYSDIQGVSYEIHGVLGTLLRFGTVAIEKISTGSAVSLSQVPRPKTVEATILRNMETYLHSKNMKNAKHIEELLSTFVAQHMQEDTLKESRQPAPAPRKKKSPAFSSARIRSKRS
jgi:hypothetical protein